MNSLVIVTNHYLPLELTIHEFTILPEAAHPELIREQMADDILKSEHDIARDKYNLQRITPTFL